MKPSRHKNRRIFLRKSLERVVLAPLAALTGKPVELRPDVPPDQRLPGDPGYRDPDCFESLAEPDEE